MLRSAVPANRRRLCVGMLNLFRARVADHNRLTWSLSGGSYTIYLIHLPIVVALQVALSHARLPVLVTFVVLAVLGIAASAVAAHFIRRLSAVRTVL